ncbi:hypothetical protein D3C72_2596160 [compost metagenome]
MVYSVISSLPPDPAVSVGFAALPALVPPPEHPAASIASDNEPAIKMDDHFFIP